MLKRIWFVFDASVSGKGDEIQIFQRKDAEYFKENVNYTKSGYYCYLLSSAFLTNPIKLCALEGSVHSYTPSAFVMSLSPSAKMKNL